MTAHYYQVKHNLKLMVVTDFEFQSLFVRFYQYSRILVLHISGYEFVSGDLSNGKKEI